MISLQTASVGTFSRFFAPVFGVLLAFSSSLDAAPVKSLAERRTELEQIRRARMGQGARLLKLQNWLRENRDWTRDLPPAPANLIEARRQNSLAQNRGAREPWIIRRMKTQKYHEGGVWEVRQAFDLPNQKFPGAGTQGIYDGKGALIAHEGTPDVASPRSFWAGDLEAHAKTDVALWQEFVDKFGPLEGEKKYRALYNVALSARFSRPEMAQRQRNWERANKN